MLVVALPLLVAVACGDDGDSAATATSPSTSATAPATTVPDTAAPVTAAPTTIAATTAPTTAMTAPMTTPATSAPAAGSDVEVEMRLLAFRPERLSVEAGQTIRWTQSDAGFHTITSGTVQQSGGIVTTAPDGRFDSGQLATDATFELTLTEPGSYEYFCAIHPATMHGVIDVT